MDRSAGAAVRTIGMFRNAMIEIMVDDLGGNPDGAHPGMAIGGAVGLEDVAAHAGAVAVDDRRGERHRHAGGREGDDGERADLAVGGHVHLVEIGGEAAGAGLIQSASSSRVRANPAR